MARCVRGYIVVNWNWNNYEINYYLLQSKSKRQTISKLTVCVPECQIPLIAILMFMFTTVDDLALNTVTW